MPATRRRRNAFAARLAPTPENDAARAALNRMMSSDEDFAEAFAKLKAVTGYVLENDSGDELAPVNTPFAVEGAAAPFGYVTSFQYAARALPLFETSSAGTGALNLLPDRDGVLRNVALLYRLNNQIVPSLDAEAMRLAGGPLVAHGAEGSVPGVDAMPRLKSISAGGLSIPTRRDGAMTLYFARDTEARALDLSSVIAKRAAGSEAEHRRHPARRVKPSRRRPA